MRFSILGRLKSPRKTGVVGMVMAVVMIIVIGDDDLLWW